jgi:hypothetical protein
LNVVLTFDHASPEKQGAAVVGQKLPFVNRGIGQKLLPNANRNKNGSVGWLTRPNPGAACSWQQRPFHRSRQSLNR